MLMLLLLMLLLLPESHLNHFVIVVHAALIARARFTHHRLVMALCRMVCHGRATYSLCINNHRGTVSRRGHQRVGVVCQDPASLGWVINVRRCGNKLLMHDLLLRRHAIRIDRVYAIGHIGNGRIPWDCKGSGWASMHPRADSRIECRLQDHFGHSRSHGRHLLFHYRRIIHLLRLLRLGIEGLLFHPRARHETYWVAAVATIIVSSMELCHIP
mmetsp:Transcript_10434/g.17910  ORF Transcript_10434/g.17910 Transcript_10434/m.17910 type:complete len:214 (+) Transcript_10434:46-687(+)